MRSFSDVRSGSIASLKEEKAKLPAETAKRPDLDFKVLTHLRLAEVYRKKVGQLETLLEGSDHLAALELIRSMIDQVVLTPSMDGKLLNATLVGDLAATMNICEGIPEKSGLPGIAASGSQLSVVAGGRYNRDRTVVFLGG